MSRTPPSSITVTNLKVDKMGTASITAYPEKLVHAPIVVSIPRPAPDSRDRPTFDRLIGAAKFLFKTNGSGEPTTGIRRSYRWTDIPENIRVVILNKLEEAEANKPNTGKR